MSLEPVFFVFCIVFLVSFLLSPALRKWPLIIGNLIFLFSLNHKFSFVFLTIAGINYFVKKEKYLSVLVTINVSFLIFFKYLLANIDLHSWNVVLPLGLSVFIFQQIAFLFDRRRHPELKKLCFPDYLLYSFLFTSLVTGPVSRLSVLVEKNGTGACFYFQSTNLIKGGVLISLGLFQKLVIADNISVLTTPMLKPETAYEGYDITLAFLLNKYEIFANFSGYTDVALGMALVFGIHLPVNFNRPFKTPSITEFWKRWHMSLSHWIRDYVFFPLTLSPLGKFGVTPILFITFTLFAIWHDFKLTFILYGWIQVLLILSSRFIRIPTFTLKWLFFYVVLLSVPAILFRVSEVDQFVLILHKLTTFSSDSFFATIAGYKGVLLRIFLGVAFYELFIHYCGVEKFARLYRDFPYMMKMGFVTLFFLVLLMMSGLQNGSQFIYSRF